jgi:hypothetical protein
MLKVLQVAYSCNIFQPKAENTPHQQVISHHRHHFNAVVNEESADVLEPHKLVLHSTLETGHVMPLHDIPALSFSPKCSPSFSSPHDYHSSFLCKLLQHSTLRHNP